MAHSSALLEGYLGLSGALGNGKLDHKPREFIALAVSERNGCSYCLSAHTTIGNKILCIDEANLLKSRTEESMYDRTDAALHFASAIVDKKSKVSEADIAAVKEAVVKDATAAAQTPDMDGYKAALTNFTIIASGTLPRLQFRSPEVARQSFVCLPAYRNNN